MSDRFKAATWNVYHGTPLDDLAPVLEKLLADGVTLFLIQEGSQAGLPRMLRDHGLRAFRRSREFVIAWDPKEWVLVDRSAPDLAETPFYRRGGAKPVILGSAAAILSDRQGRTLTALTYHTPAHVQVPEHARPERRVQALREAMTTLADLADAAHTRAVLFGGDDNVDENGAWRKFWAFMRTKATGLRLVRAPKPTIGHPSKGRRIDDFRVRGLRVRRGTVRPGGGDHRVHVRTFQWR